MPQDADIMTPVVNIFSELKELKASLDGLRTDLNSAKNELEEQKILIQDLRKQVKGKFSNFLGVWIQYLDIVVTLQLLPFSMNKHYSHFLVEILFSTHRESKSGIHCIHVGNREYKPRAF